MKDNIKALRLRRGLTQTQLAVAMGYNSCSAIAMWESGERKPPSDKLPLLASTLGCTIDELFGEAMEPESEAQRAG